MAVDFDFVVSDPRCMFNPNPKGDPLAVVCWMSNLPLRVLRSPFLFSC
jgi:hypothetical protein